MKTSILILTVVISVCGQGSSLGQPQPDTAAAIQAISVPSDPGFAQIKVIAQATNDSVVLRWAPTTPHGWRVANYTGYVVERRSGSDPFVRITPDTIHQWMPEQFIQMMNENPDHPYLGLALNALWGDSTLLSTEGGRDTVGELAEKNTTLYSYALFAADNDPLIAEALGLRYVDRTVRSGERYTYRISLNEPRDYRIDAGEVTVDVRPSSAGPRPANLAANGLDKRIDLRWDAQPTNEYSGYNIFRSDDDGRTFKKLNNRPIVLLTTPGVNQLGVGVYTDSSIVNYKIYKYRVIGMNAFGEPGMPGEVEAFGRDMTPPPSPIIKNPEQLAKTRIRLSWEMPEMVADFLGFIVSRSAFVDSNYHQLTPRPLARTVREYIDENADDFEPYYIVGAVDTAGNVAPSFPVYAVLIDTMPPSVPKGLLGSIDTNGVVHLQWKPNPERNLLGYRVLRANAVDHEFAQLTGDVWKDTLFADTVETNTLTRYVYYKITAVNNHYNHSELSPVLGLRRPDRVPPEAPVFTDVQVSDSSVMLAWAASTSEDMHSQVIYRRVSEQPAWEKLITLSRVANLYVDTAVNQNTMYEYLVEAVDSTGYRTPAELAVQARPYDTGVRSPVTGLRAVYDEDEKRVVLNWSYAPKKGESFFYVIYRATAASALSQYKSAASTQLTFIDEELLGPGTYEYAIKVMTDNGAQSPLSERARVSVTGK